jgi:hypothetical protein
MDRITPPVDCLDEKTNAELILVRFPTTACSGTDRRR